MMKNVAINKAIHTDHNCSNLQSNKYKIPHDIIYFLLHNIIHLIRINIFISIKMAT